MNHVNSIERTKDKVKANIYKRLLEEEKIRHKKYVAASVSIFLVGIISTSSYQYLNSNSILRGSKTAFLLDKNGSYYDNNKLEADHFFSNDIFKDTKKIVVDTDQVFGFSN